jgi:hypothetical protein
MVTHPPCFALTLFVTQKPIDQIRDLTRLLLEVMLAWFELWVRQAGIGYDN